MFENFIQLQECTLPADTLQIHFKNIYVFHCLGLHAWLCPHQRVLQNLHDAWRFKTYRRGALTSSWLLSWTSNTEMLLIFHLSYVLHAFIHGGQCIYKLQLVVVLFLLSIVLAEICKILLFNILFSFIPSFKLCSYLKLEGEICPANWGMKHEPVLTKRLEKIGNSRIKLSVTIYVQACR